MVRMVRVTCGEEWACDMWGRMGVEMEKTEQKKRPKKAHTPQLLLIELFGVLLLSRLFELELLLRLEELHQVLRVRRVETLPG